VNWKKRIVQGLFGGSVGAGLAIGLGWLLVGFHLGDQLKHLSYDLLFALRADMRIEEAVIVYLDDISHQGLKQSFLEPWDRSLHAQLVERLTADGAKAVVFDIVFADPWHKGEGVDERFAKALRAHGRVFLAALELPAADLRLQSTEAQLPNPVLRNAAAGWGLATLTFDADLINRQHYPGNQEFPSLAWAVAQALDAPVTRQPSRRLAPRWFNYYGPALSIPCVSYATALASNEVSPSFFRDKVVFVGERPTATFTGAKREEYPTPYTALKGGFSPAVEILATAFLNLYRGDWLERFHPVVEALLLVFAGLVLGYGLALFRPLPAGGMAAAAGLVLFIVSVACCWLTRRWYAWLIVVGAQLPAAYLWSVVYNSLRTYVEKRLLEQSLALHLSPARVKQIQRQPELLRPGADKQEISILFTDIANFTRVTARMEPEDLFRLLNNYFEASLNCIHATDGTVVKLIGDGIFAIWNAPFVQPDQQERAVRAALMLRDRLVRFEAAQHSLPLRTRAGLHTGQAFVGNVGSTTRFDYTAIGEPVNVASRLENLNKYLGTDLLATRDIQKIVEQTVASRMVGHFRFKGVERVVEVHELIGPADQAEPSRPWREAFADALFHFQRRAFGAAETRFRRALELKPADGPALFYLERLAEFLAHPPPDDWAGEIELKEK
jgi:adenylate cyclase